jgi:hypothetical protein
MASATIRRLDNATKTQSAAKHASCLHRDTF